MPLRISVELRDGTVCQMAKRAFNVFLSLDKVSRFKRAEGWIVVDEASLRDLEKDNDYALFAERRAFF